MGVETLIRTCRISQVVIAVEIHILGHVLESNCTEHPHAMVASIGIHTLLIIALEHEDLLEFCACK